MVRIHATWILVLLAGLAPADLVMAQSSQAPPAPISLRSADRVALIGDAFLEREYRYGLIETALTLAHPDRRLTFRGLGWSGDTVWGHARAYRGEPKDGYAELMKSLDMAGPTIIFVAYGANESFAGDAGLDAFVAQYRALLDELARRTPRIVLLTPLPVEAASSPLPAGAVEARMRDLATYTRAIRDLAQARGLATIDLFTMMQPAPGGPRLFQNGMHLTDGGYEVVAGHIAERTLPAGDVARFRAAWQGPEPRSWGPLRDLIVAKNDAFFHRWRPANVAYIYLSRRGGQGTTAAEIPTFDPVVAEKEQAIASLLATLTTGGAR